MAYLFATLTLLLCAGVYWAAWHTINYPEKPIWPPRHFGMGARLITWAVTILAIGSAFQAGSLSWNAWNLLDWLRFYIGFPLVFISSSVSSYAIVQLGLDQSMGANLKMVGTGLFSRSRNPTYIANVMLCVGFVLLAASTPALIAAASLAALYIAVVPLEEAWLSATYGDEYERYKVRVRRWL